MPKRSATPVAPKAKAAKVQAKKEEITWQPALTAIAEVTGLSKTCREMLVSAVPHCAADLHNPHAFQTQVLDQIDELLRQTETVRLEEARKVEQHTEELEAEKQENAAALAAASEKVSSLKEAWDQAKAKYQDDSAVVAAKADLEEKTARQARLVEEREATEKKQQELQKVMEEAWKPLKECSPALCGKNWRAGRKAAERVSEMLRVAEVPGSLQQAVPVSLSQKLPDRKEFALLTIQYGEKAMASLQSSYAATLAAFEGEAASRAAATAAAKEALDAAKATRQQLFHASIDAENSWNDEQGQVLECKRKEKALGSRSANIANWREAAEQALEKTRAVLAGYRAWRSPPADPLPQEGQAASSGDAVAEAAPTAVATSDTVMSDSGPAATPSAATGEAPVPAVATA